MSSRNKLKSSFFVGHDVPMIILAGVFFAGSLLGSLYARAFSERSVLSAYIKSHVLSFGAGDISVSYIAVLIDTLRFPMLIFLLSFAAVGPVGIPLVFFYRGFCFCYAISVFYLSSGFSGLLCGGLLIGISALFWVPAMFGLGIQGLKVSCGVFFRSLGDRRGYPCFNRAYFVRCAVCFGVLFIGSIFEFSVVPVFLPFIGDLF